MERVSYKANLAPHNERGAGAKSPEKAVGDTKVPDSDAVLVELKTLLTSIDEWDKQYGTKLPDSIAPRAVSTAEKGYQIPATEADTSLIRKLRNMARALGAAERAGKTDIADDIRARLERLYNTLLEGDPSRGMDLLVHDIFNE